jgi:hypothetical protein
MQVAIVKLVLSRSTRPWVRVPFASAVAVAVLIRKDEVAKDAGAAPLRECLTPESRLAHVLRLFDE